MGVYYHNHGNVIFIAIMGELSVGEKSLGEMT